MLPIAVQHESRPPSSASRVPGPVAAGAPCLSWPAAADAGSDVDMAFDAANSARMTNFLLGGSYHWRADRDLAARLSAAVPDLTTLVWHNRWFQHRVVEYLLAVGIRQFIDLGSGIPVLGAVHQIARRIAPETKVVYVDRDPLIVELGRMLLSDQPRTLIVDADLSNPHTVIHDPDINDLLDLGQPVAVLALAALDHLPDDAAAAAVPGAVREWSMSGSYLAISHMCHHPASPHAGALAQLAREAGIPIASRSPMQIRELFRGWQLVPPGLTWTAGWRPDIDAHPHLGAQPQRSGLLAGLALAADRSSVERLPPSQTSALPVDDPRVPAGPSRRRLSHAGGKPADAGVCLRHPDAGVHVHQQRGQVDDWQHRGNLLPAVANLTYPHVRVLGGW